MADLDRTRRALVAAIVAATVGGGLLSPASSYLARFAPFSGSVWRSTRQELPDAVDSPYGAAELRYDDAHVPHISAANDAALYYAVGYVQAADRLFQMDLQRRQMRGQLSAVVGDATLDSDTFHVRMDFVGAAEATWKAVADTETGAIVRAYADGVNAGIDALPLPLEFDLLSYEPAAWTPVDTMLMEKQISWNLTGSFRTLRQAVLRGKLDGPLYDALYPWRMDHDVPIIRRGKTGGNVTADRGRRGPAGSSRRGDAELDREPDAGADLSLDPTEVAHLSTFESPPGVGSNSWVVSGEHTATGAPLLANDPHLTLFVPPVWYQQDLRTDEMTVRGVTFPGVPFVVIGENHAGAWGFTNTGADVLDCYRYETDGDRYRYRGEWRDYDETTETIEVSGRADEQVTVKKTVHGPVLTRQGREVAVAWTGLTATDTTLAIRSFAHADGPEDVLAATRQFDEPTQNLVYASRDGDTLYYVTGRIPDRRIDGKNVRGDRVFDGSTGEAEWRGFTPYGQSSWEGFVPFEAKPHVVNPDYVGTANQRVVDDPSYYLSEGFAPPFRAIRIYERLDATVGNGETVDAAFVKDLQHDVLDERAAMLVPALLDLGDRLSGDTATTLEGWDYRMRRDSTAALVFARWFHHYRHALFADAFDAQGLDDSYWPNDWVVTTLPADSPWFDELGRSRADVMVAAMSAARSEITVRGWETYGDYNVLDLQHPFQLDFLAYPEHRMNGSPDTLKNFRKESGVGSSWRQVASLEDGEMWGVLPGGNSGEYFSAHYHDQLAAWADDGYRRLGQVPDGPPDVTFGGERP